MYFPLFFPFPRKIHVLNSLNLFACFILYILFPLLKIMDPPRKTMVPESSFWPAEKIAGNDDLLTEILLRLPATTLLRFKSVSSHWRSLISSPEFRQLHSCHRTAVTDGVFLFRKSDKRYHLDHLLNFSENIAKKDVPFNIRTFIDSFPLVEPMHYCNGLLCLKLHLDNGEVFYCVYNPCTNRYTNIPLPDLDLDEEIFSMNLAFDPLSSCNYKVVCLVGKRLRMFRFLIFCSSSWKKSKGQVIVGVDYYYRKGVYLNGAIHLVSKVSPFLCFDVDNESIKDLPSTSIPEGVSERRIKYFGESAGKLHLIEESVYRPTLLNVFELEKDYSKWFVKYMVDVDRVTWLFPSMVINEPETLDVIGYQFDVLCFVDGEIDGKTMFVLSLPGKMISYNIKNRDIKELLKVQLEELHLSNEGYLVPLEELHLSNEGYLVYNYKWYHAYKHVETLALV